MTFEPGRQLRIARIGKPHGIRGEVTVELYTDSPERRFAIDTVLSVQRPDGSPVSFNELTVESVRWHQKILLLKFVEVSDRTSAERLRNAELFVAADESPEDEDGWYADDLIGLAVHRNSRSSPKIGEVTDLVIGPAQDLLEIELADGSKALIPFVEEIVPEIDKELGAIVITPPPGLLELNQS